MPELTAKNFDGHCQFMKQFMFWMKEVLCLRNVCVDLVIYIKKNMAGSLHPPQTIGLFTCQIITKILMEYNKFNVKI